MRVRLGRLPPPALSFMAAMLVTGAAAQDGTPVRIGTFAIDRTEVTVAAFARFAEQIGRTTDAERDGGGFEFTSGWTRRPGWTFRTPFGQPGAGDDPAVHLTWVEAQDFCVSSGGRLPTAAEWRQAAYHEQRATPTDGLARGTTYRFPVGDTAAGMNTSGEDAWPRQAPVGATRRGVNGLYDMGGNAWEWLADRRGESALTAGGSWWYGPAQTEAEAMQWKPAGFYAVYVGFRCAYD